MDRNIFYNVDKIIKIEIFDKKLHTYHEFILNKKQRKGFWRKIDNLLLGNFYRENYYACLKDEQQYMIISDFLYRKPYVKIEFENNNILELYFDSYQEVIYYKNFILNSSKSQFINK